MHPQAEKTVASKTPKTDAQITSELIRQVAEQVWQLWQADLSIEKERCRSSKYLPRWNSQGGI